MERVFRFYKGKIEYRIYKYIVYISTVERSIDNR